MVDTAVRRGRRAERPRQTRRDREAIWRDEEEGRNATRSYSIGVSERDFLEEHDEDADEGERPCNFSAVWRSEF